jgi:hypothetical protein
MLSSVDLVEIATSPEARPPLPRSGAAAVTLPEHGVVAIGGYDEGKSTSPDTPPPRKAVSDALLFSHNAWQPLSVPLDDELPTPRLAAGAVELGGHAYLIGGWASGVQGPEAFLSDVWRLSPPSSSSSSSSSSWRWERLTLAPGSLEALGGSGISRFACAAVSPTRAILHTHRCDDHVVALDVVQGNGEEARLSRLAVLPDPQHGAPSSRGLQSMTLVEDDRMLVFGGAPQKGGMLGDLWALDGDFASSSSPLRWTRLWPPPGEEEEGGSNSPHVRCSHVACAARGGLLVLGGSYYTEAGSLAPLDDAWWYDASSSGGGGGRWHRVELRGKGTPPAARNAAILAPLPPGGEGQQQQQRFLYHGGWRPFVETYNDTWIVSV